MITKKYKDLQGNVYETEPEFADKLPLGSVEITEEEAAALVEKFNPANSKPDVGALRAAAYREEADPLFFKYQRGEATREEWLDKIEEIKQREF